MVKCTDESTIDALQPQSLPHPLLATLAKAAASTAGSNDLPAKNAKKNSEVAVVPSYRDYANAIDETGKGQSTPRQSFDRNFVEKLHHLLSDMEKEKLDHIAGWQPHGRCFVVRKTEAFEERILPV